MLTPCKSEEHWVVIELCDEIRIEAIELAVWEFFSGIVREVKVSVGGTEQDEDENEGESSSRVTESGANWKEVGIFVGRNVRGVQVRIGLFLKTKHAERDLRRSRYLWLRIFIASYVSTSPHIMAPSFIVLSLKLKCLE